jgi:hypothetical protein
MCDEIPVYARPLGPPAEGWLVDDGIRYCDYPEIKDNFIKFLDNLYDSTTRKCKGKLQDKHLCQDDEGMQPFLDCLNNNAFSAVASSLPRLARYMSEEKCKKATEYFTSAQLWETDFPYHLQPCINQCHEL